MRKLNKTTRATFFDTATVGEEFEYSFYLYTDVVKLANTAGFQVVYLQNNTVKIISTYSPHENVSLSKAEIESILKFAPNFTDELVVTLSKALKKFD